MVTPMSVWTELSQSKGREPLSSSNIDSFKFLSHSLFPFLILPVQNIIMLLLITYAYMNTSKLNLFFYLQRQSDTE